MTTHHQRSPGVLARLCAALLFAAAGLAAIAPAASAQQCEGLVAYTGDAGQVRDTSATIFGIAGGCGTAVTYHFEWGPTTAYGHRTEVRPLSEFGGPTVVAADLTGLEPGRTYHYRLVVNAVPSLAATRALAAQQLQKAGLDRTFTTVPGRPEQGPAGPPGAKGDPGPPGSGGPPSARPPGGNGLQVEMRFAGMGFLVSEVGFRLERELVSTHRDAPGPARPLPRTRTLAKILLRVDRGVDRDTPNLLRRLNTTGSGPEDAELRFYNGINEVLRIGLDDGVLASSRGKVRLAERATERLRFEFIGATVEDALLGATAAGGRRPRLGRRRRAGALELGRIVRRVTRMAQPPGVVPQPPGQLPPPGSPFVNRIRPRPPLIAHEIRLRRALPKGHPFGDAHVAAASSFEWTVERPVQGWTADDRPRLVVKAPTGRSTLVLRAPATEIGLLEAFAAELPSMPTVTVWDARHGPVARWSIESWLESYDLETVDGSLIQTVHLRADLSPGQWFGL